MSLSPFHTDIRPRHFMVRFLPQWMRPYLSLMRLDRPIGTWLLLLPAWWAIVMMAGGILRMTPNHSYLLFLFAMGAIIMRGAGCAINDLWDRNLDKLVERTKDRPLASGALTVRQAIIFTVCLLLVGLGILIQLQPMAICLGVLSLVPVILYPLAKRVTWYPQAVLGLTFNFGALIGAAAVMDSVPMVAVLLYIGGFFWTMGYDTIYAHQDIVDDGIVGIKSTALKFGARSRTYIASFYGIFAGLIYMTGIISHAGVGFYIFWAAASFHLLWQVSDVKFDQPEDCLRKFRSNREFGFLVLMAYLCGYIYLI